MALALEIWRITTIIISYIVEYGYPGPIESLKIFWVNISWSNLIVEYFYCVPIEPLIYFMGEYFRATLISFFCHSPPVYSWTHNRREVILDPETWSITTIIISYIVEYGYPGTIESSKIFWVNISWSNLIVSYNYSDSVSWLTQESKKVALDPEIKRTTTSFFTIL